MVATLVVNHPHHPRAVAALDRHLDAGNSMIIVAHTLLETYSSLTRMPAPMKTTPEDALRGIEQSFLANGTVATLRDLELCDYFTIWRGKERSAARSMTRRLWRALGGPELRS